MARAIVVLAPGAEESEVVITVDVLRRGGVEVLVAGLEGKGAVRCSRDVSLVPDTALDDVIHEEFDAVVLPGGAGGAQRLASSPTVSALLHRQEARGGWIAAICAAPIALVSNEVGRGRKMTSHPTVRDRVEGFARWEAGSVVEDGRLLTGAGPGAAFEFGLALVGKLAGAETADRIRGPLMLG
jgi:protein DJ-1